MKKEDQLSDQMYFFKRKTIMMSFLFFSILFISLFSSSIHAGIYLGIVDGYVTNSTGDPLDGADVSVSLSGCSGDGCSGAGTTDSNGYYSIGNLNFGSGMTVTVSVSKGKWQGSASSTAVDDTTPIRINVQACFAPNPPSLSPQSDTHETSATLSWSSDPASEYDIYRFDGMNFNDSISPQFEADLDYDNYVWGVKSCMGSCCSNFAYDSFEVFNNPPPAPNLDDQTNTFSTDVTLSWTSYDDPESGLGDTTYDVFQFQNNPLVDDASSPMQISGLSIAGSPYTWKVKTCDNLGACSAWSSDSFSVVNQIPPQPTLEDIEDVHTSYFTFNWSSYDDPDGHDTHDEFRIYRDGSIYYSNNSIESPFEKELEFGNYVWNVRTCDSFGGCSPWSEDQFVSVNDAPASPDIQEITYSATESVEFLWDSGIDPDGDDIVDEFQISSVPDFNTFIYESDNESSGLVLSLTSLNVYYWRVRTCDSFGSCSGWSEDFFPIVPIQEKIIYRGGGGGCDDEDCTPEWNCTDWSVCNKEGKQFRVCHDLNGCADSEIPAMVRRCVYKEKKQEREETECPICESPMVMDRKKVGQIEFALYSNGEVGIIDEGLVNTISSAGLGKVDINDIFSCEGETTVSLDERPRNVPSGYSYLGQSFAIDEENILSYDVNGKVLESVISVPENYRNISVMKCENGNCVIFKTKKIDHGFCGWDLEHEKWDQKQDQDLEKEVQIEELDSVSLRRIKLEKGHDEFSSQGHFLKIRDLQKDLNIQMYSESEISYPSERSLDFLNIPVTFKFEDLVENIVEVKLPVDEISKYQQNSLRVYIKNSSSFVGWSPLPARTQRLNEGESSFFVEIENLVSYVKDNEITLAVLGRVKGEEGDRYQLRKIHEPTPSTKDALILVGDMQGSQKMQQIADLFKASNQPVQVWSFDYPIYESLDEISYNLVKLIEEKQVQNRNSYEHISIVGYSSGGIIVHDALSKANAMNQEYADDAEFLRDVEKVFLVGVPHYGFGDLQEYSRLVGLPEDHGTFQQIESYNPEFLPDIDYFFIAGMEDEESSSQFDGVVSIESAKGESYCDDVERCENYWIIESSHEELMSDMTVSRIIRKNLFKELSSVLDNPLLEGRYYYLFRDVRSDSDAEYHVIGIKDTRVKAFDDTGCRCGNGYCGVGESELSCYSDCGVFFNKENRCLLSSLASLLFAVLFSYFLINETGRKSAQGAFTKKIYLSASAGAVSVFLLSNVFVEGCYIDPKLISSFSATFFTYVYGLVASANNFIFRSARLKNFFRKNPKSLGSLKNYIKHSMESHEKKLKRKIRKKGWDEKKVEEAFQIAKQEKKR